MIHGRAGVVLFTRRFHTSEPRVLAVTNRGYGGFSLPGGKIEEGEDIRRGACREVKEETSITVIASDLTLLAKGDSVRTDSLYEVHVFFARHAWGSAKNVEQGTYVDWLEWSELLEFSPFKSFYERWLPDGVHHLRETIFAQSIAPKASP